MAELPAKVHLTTHPLCLRICGPSVYDDEDQRTWVQLVMDTEGVLQVRLRQEDIHTEDMELTTSLLTLSSMPWMWKLFLSGQYLELRFRFWRIVHHIKENGVEEMILELMDIS